MMKRKALLVVAAVGFFLATGSHGNRAAAPPNNEESAYAKIELKGQLSENVMMTGPFVHVWNGFGGDNYPLDLGKGPKEFQGEGWRKLKGKTVIVTGRLIFLPSNVQLRVQVESIRVVDD